MEHVAKSKWTRESLEYVANKYTRRADFRKREIGAVKYAIRNNILNEVCAHMDTKRAQKRTIDDCREVALKYKVMKDFQKNDGAIYLFAKRRKWLHEITQHMKKNNKWEGRINDLHQIALKYDNRGEFYKKDNKYYGTARGKGWLDEICRHMVPIGNKLKRMVYVYEFEDNTAYVGLTYNDKRRGYAHANSNDSPVYKYAVKTKLTPVKKIITDGYVDAKLAQKMEEDKINEYKQNGWEVLNRAKPGSLGGNTIIWTKEKIMEVVSKYTLKSEFRRKEKQAWCVTRKLGIVNEVCKDLINDDTIKYDELMVKNEIKKYTVLSDFTNNSKLAYAWICRNKRFDLITHLKRRNKWTVKENVINEALKYETRSSFNRLSPGAYLSAFKHGWTDEAFSHMTSKVKVNGYMVKWTKEKVLEIASKYKYTKDFRNNDRIVYEIGMKKGWLIDVPLIKQCKYWNAQSVKEEALKYKHKSSFEEAARGAYYYAKRNGIFDEVCSHMIRKNTKRSR